MNRGLGALFGLTSAVLRRYKPRMRKFALCLCSLLTAASLHAGPMGGSTASGRGIVMEVPQVDLYNHTLLGERVLANEVVCRYRWGTPMLPDGTGGYSLIAAINPEFIAQSLIIPPLTSGPVYNPAATLTAPDILPGEQPLPTTSYRLPQSSYTASVETRSAAGTHAFDRLQLVAD